MKKLSAGSSRTPDVKFLNIGGSLFYLFILLLLLFSTQANALNYQKAGLAKASRFAEKNGFTENIIKTDYFNLLSFLKVTHDKEMTANDSLVVYVEGDGNAFTARKKLSRNPTPKKHLVFTLASLDPRSKVAYIARPCQYIDPSSEPNFSPKFWSSARYNEKVIDSISSAIDVLKEKAHASKVHLVGYSGGAAIAVILAATRKDVSSLVTISGNLDHIKVNEFNQVTPLSDSLNPIDYADRLKGLPQKHYYGIKDKIIPYDVIKSFALKTGDTQLGTVIPVKFCSHDKGWKKYWENLSSR